MARLLAIPAFAASVRPDQIKAGYYSIKALNPSGIVPVGPQLDYLRADGDGDHPAAGFAVTPKSTGTQS